MTDFFVLLQLDGIGTVRIEPTGSLISRAMKQTSVNYEVIQVK